MQFGIVEAINHWGLYSPKSIAIVSDSIEYTYFEFNKDINKIAAIIDRTFTKDKRLSILCDSKYNYLRMLLGIISAAKSAVLLNPDVAITIKELCLRDAETVNCITDQKNNIEFKSLSPDINIYNYSDLENLTESSELSFAEKELHPTDECAIFYSSGTTGIPKGIVRNHYSVMIELLGWVLELNLSNKTHFYIGRPIYYTGGLVLSLAALFMGGSICIDNKVSWENYQNHLNKYKTRYAFFIPSQLMKYVNKAENMKQPKKKVETILTMGEKISGDEKIKAHEVLGSNIIESWGNSESLGTITNIGDLRIRPDSIGRPFITDKMYIVDNEGNKLSPNMLGRLAGNEEAGFDYYCGKPQFTKEIKKKGLIISEDVGYVDLNGYYYIEGRIDDIILIGNNSILLEELEEVILKSCDIPSIKLVLFDYSKDFINLGCAVQIKDELKREDMEKINNILQNELKKYDIKPNINIKVKSFDKFPLTASGKLSKVKIKEHFND